MNIFEEIYNKNRFDSYYEHEVFERNIKKALSLGKIKEIPPKNIDNKIGWEYEKWYLCTETNEVYRYSPANYPDRGLWEPVER